MTDVILWIVALGAGFICGRVSTPAEPTKQDEYDQEHLKRMTQDIAYYKKLTRKLAEENQELRQKIK